MNHLFPTRLDLRIFAVCFVGVHVPLLAYVAFHFDDMKIDVALPLLLATLAGTAGTLAAINHLLSPLKAATAALHAYAADRAIADLPSAGRDLIGDLCASISVVRERSEDQIARLHAVATSDPLTGLPNRRAFTEFVADAVRTQPCAVAIVDIDHFKSVNDTLGHDAGDTVLQLVANRIQQGVRTGDFVARLGGEEFAILLPGASPDAALQIVDRIRSDLAATSPLTIRNRPVTFSAGLTTFSADDPSIDVVLKRADVALYEAKHAGRNRVSVALAA
ncbi:diguanylate cyclase (GGDEF)-like protein [Bosea sp. OAE506]|uniref:GGDEF domain-containing protein n=1 Tax=Bosea sp. OAE506 TaxID=2663870 RepID=UPI00178948F2